MKAAPLFALAAACALANAAQDPLQTHFPGQVSAAGGTSGEVMARAGELRKVDDEGGTPGIPKGAEGNTGGPNMGANAGQSQLGGSGKTSQPSQASQASQATQGSQAPQASQAASAASSPAKTTPQQQAAAQAAALAERMDRVAALWRAGHAAGEGGHVPTEAAPTTLRSEKLGTAAPSADVKQPKPGASGATR